MDPEQLDQASIVRKRFLGQLKVEIGNPAFGCLPSSTAGESMAHNGSQLYYSTLRLECCDARQTHTITATEKFK